MKGLKSMLQFDGDQIPVFWGEVAPSHHFVQFYERDEVFMDTLADFIGGALLRDESAIVIGTEAHRENLEERLKTMGVDVDAVRADDRYIFEEAETVLARFMVDGSPDEDRFHSCINELLARARKVGRRVRAFGEMVALLWSQGNAGATVRLEQLWHRLVPVHDFSLFCAYPRAEFIKNAQRSIQEICDLHHYVMPA